MDNTEKLVAMLQPKDYVSKIKLYCQKAIFEVVKVPKDKIPHKKQINITEIP